MSEFLAEASVLIQADTRAFRAELAAALATVPKTVPIEIVAAGGAGSVAATKKAVAVATRDSAGAAQLAAKSVNEEAAARQRAGVITQRQTADELRSASATRAAATRRNEITKGLQAQALSAVGLRGAIIGANTAFLAATAGAILFGKSLQSAAQFQTELATFAATTGATASQIQDVSDAAKQLGADLTLPGVNAQDAAVAMTELAKAGLDVQESISGARGVLQLATAAGIDNAAATELAASALNAFGLSGDQAVHVADVLANSANDAQGSITDIGIALQQASAAGRQAGLSLEETTGILTIFARNGIKGSDAGTLLRTMLIRLINPTNKAQEVIQKLGLHLRDATGGVNIGFFDEFARKTRNLTAAERDRDAAIITGQDAFRGLSILARTGGAALDQQVTALNASGTAAELAAARTSGLAGAAENLKNQLATAGLAFGQSLAPGLTDFTNLVAEAVGKTQDLVTQVKNLTDQAARPIDIVVNVIRKFTGGGDNQGDQQVRKDVQGRIQSILSLDETAPQFLGDVNALANEANAVLEDKLFKGAGLTDFPTLTQARKQIHDLITELNATPGPTQLNETVVALLKIQKAMEGGTFGTKEFAKSLGPFIARLQNLSSTKITLPPISFPRTLEPGAQAAVESSAQGAAKTGAHAFATEFIPSVGNAFKAASTAGWQAFQAAAATNAAETAAKISAAIRSATAGVARGAGQQAGLDDVMNQILLGGGSPQQQVGNLQKQFAVQQSVIDKATSGLKGLGSGDKGFATLTKAVREARAKQVAINNQITSIQDAAQRDAQTAADKRVQDAKKAQQDRTKADQHFIDALGAGRRPLEIKITRAEGTDTVTDDLKRQQQLRARILGEIDAISKRDFEDAKDKATALAARRQELAGVVNTITTLRQQQNAQITQLATDKFNLRVSIAQATGNTQLLIKLFNQRIHDTQVAIDKAKDDSKKQLELKQTLAQTQKDREDAVSGLEEKRIQLAELRGNKNAELDLIDARIERLKKAIAAAKRQHKATIDLQLELAQTEKDRKDLLDQAEEANKQHTTAFDLLKEAADTFNQNAGNLINGNQPFAGPTGFTADIAQFLIRRQQPTAPTTGRTGGAPAPPVELQDQPLIQAIEKLTNAIEGSTPGNTSTSTGTRASKRWHAENMIARQFQEA